jgi:YcaO-like protein with predicted kinase domain
VAYGEGALRHSYLPGTSRTADAAATFARARKLFAPLGITRVANVTGLDCIGIPVVMVCRPNSRSLAVSQGKGVDLDAARASGVMETIELYHAERITLPLKLASYDELRYSHPIAHPDRLPRIATGRFTPDTPLLWVEGVDVCSARPLWVPYELVHQNYTLPLPPGTGCFVLSSNGLASGNVPGEAVAHGLCEVIERDAKSLWRLSTLEGQDATGIQLDTITDPVCRGLLDAYERAQVAVGVWDMTSDVGVAAFTCVIVDRQDNPFRPLGPAEGMGCHPRREVALCRALTEAAQARLTLIAGSRDDNGRTRYRSARLASLSQYALGRLASRRARDFAEVPSREHANPVAEVGHLIEALNRAGFEQVVVVDLTKPEIGIPVARVIVPGLEPYHHVPGYRPGKRAEQFLRASMAS